MKSQVLILSFNKFQFALDMIYIKNAVIVRNSKERSDRYEIYKCGQAVIKETP